MSKIFCFMGKSSSGKDTIFKIISKDFEEIKEIVPYTTRPIREGEIEGLTYYYVTDEIYQEMLANNLVVESRSYNTFHGVWTYFTAATNIDLEHNNYMIINTLEGYQKIKEYFGEDNVVPIYIQVEDGKRLQRALNREMKEPNPKIYEICRRFLADQEDFSEKKLDAAGIYERFDNNDLLECITKIENRITESLTKEKQYRIG